MKRMCCFLLLVVFLLAPTVTLAKTGEDCTGNNNDADRLKCYDAIYKDKKDEVTEQGKWQKFESNSKLDDSKLVMLSLDSDNKVEKRYAGTDVGNVTIMCREGRTIFMLGVADKFLSDSGGFGDIDYRLDKGTLKKISMDQSTDNSKLGLWRGNKSIPFIKNMFGKEKLIIRVTPFNESPDILEFNIKGLDEAIKPLREACKW